MLDLYFFLIFSYLKHVFYFIVSVVLNIIRFWCLITFTINSILWFKNKAKHFLIILTTILIISHNISESDVTYDQVWWPILGICALYLSHPKCTHTAVNTHTPWTHTRSSGQPFMLRRPGSSWGFGALLKGTSVVVLKEERALYIHSPHLQFLPARDSNSQPFDYESDSLTIRPRLPHKSCKITL